MSIIFNEATPSGMTGGRALSLTNLLIRRSASHNTNSGTGNRHNIPFDPFNPRGWAGAPGRGGPGGKGVFLSKYVFGVLLSEDVFAAGGAVTTVVFGTPDAILAASEASSAILAD
jgi:hypothetical protein